MERREGRKSCKADRWIYQSRFNTGDVHHGSHAAAVFKGSRFSGAEGGAKTCIRIIGEYEQHEQPLLYSYVLHIPR